MEKTISKPTTTEDAGDWMGATGRWREWYARRLQITAATTDEQLMDIAQLVIEEARVEGVQLTDLDVWLKRLRGDQLGDGVA